MSKKASVENNLAVLKPDLVSQWHPTKNVHLKPVDVTIGSSKNIWWRCHKGHEWISPVHKRARRGDGCPYCSGRKVGADNNLAVINPELASQWHPTKNATLAPSDVTTKSGKKVWWLCEKSHAWEAVVGDRTNGKGCPYCSGRLATAENNLAVLNPELASQWHQTKNGSLTPQNVKAASNKQVWWQCKHAHVWKTKIYHRVGGSGCPFCSGQKACKDNCLATLNPDLTNQWHPIRNSPLTPHDVTIKSGKVVWWKCNRGHDWESKIAHRSNGSGCPYCSLQTSLPEIRLYSELLSIFPNTQNRKRMFHNELDVYIEKYRLGIEFDGCFWHKNKEQRDEKKNIKLGQHGIKVIRVREEPLERISDLDVICRAERLRKTDIDSLLRNIRYFLDDEDTSSVDGYLGRKRWQGQKTFREIVSYLPGPDPSSSLKNTHAAIAAQWHIKKNKPLLPSQFTAGSGIKVWWVCDFGHEWPAQVVDRTAGTGCPYCSGRKVGDDNNLAVVNPELAAQWHPTKNLPITPRAVSVGSSKKVWWKCAKGHEWKSPVHKRARRGDGCPYCSGRKVGDDNNLAVVNPELAAQWHPTKNLPATPRDLAPKSNKKVWWLCDSDHTWDATINNRAKGDGCPYCSGQRVCADNSLSALRPNLAEEWHYEKNKPVTPNDITIGSSKSFWWKCDDGHEWQAIVSNRARENGTGCPECYRLQRKQNKVPPR